MAEDSGAVEDTARYDRFVGSAEVDELGNLLKLTRNEGESDPGVATSWIKRIVDLTDLSDFTDFLARAVRTVRLTLTPGSRSALALSSMSLDHFPLGFDTKGIFRCNVFISNVQFYVKTQQTKR